MTAGRLSDDSKQLPSAAAEGLGAAGLASTSDGSESPVSMTPTLMPLPVMPFKFTVRAPVVSPAHSDNDQARQHGNCRCASTTLTSRRADIMEGYSKQRVIDSRSDSRRSRTNTLWRRGPWQGQTFKTCSAEDEFRRHRCISASPAARPRRSAAAFAWRRRQPRHPLPARRSCMFATP